MSSELKVDTISEKTSANGVTIDGVKLKDNAVETDTISEKTSGSGVTIDSVLIKDGNVDGVDVSALNTTVSGLTSNPAYTIVDTWGLSSTLSSTASPITSWSQITGSNGLTNIGSSMTQSSGIFTFPATGIYEVRFFTRADMQHNANIFNKIQSTLDNSSYNDISQTRIMTGPGLQDGIGVTVMSNAILDVTDTTQVKVRFAISGTMQSYSRVRGSGTSYSATYVQFIKIADT